MIENPKKFTVEFPSNVSRASLEPRISRTLSAGSMNVGIKKHPAHHWRPGLV